jgi:hypothetical protein
LVRRILVPLDLDLPGEAKVPVVEEYARAFGADVLLLHVLSTRAMNVDEVRPAEATARAYLDVLVSEMAAAGVRAAAMLYSAPGQCHTAVATDPAHTTMHLDLRQHPELANDPAALAAYLRSLTPWIDQPPQPGDPDDIAVFTIHPDAIPSGDQLLILPRFDRTDGATTDDEVEVRSLLVPALPPCVPRPEESVYTSNGIEPR